MPPRALVLVALACTLSACAGSDARPPSSTESLDLHDPDDEPGSTRASREAARAAEEGRPAATTARSAPALPSAPSGRPLLFVHAIAAAEGEDGAGDTIAATDPLALDLDAQQVPPRALDPVLHVGALRFVHYAHPEPGVMRFVVADRALLAAGAPVYVQYGEDATTRLELAPALELPVEVTP